MGVTPDDPVFWFLLSARRGYSLKAIALLSQGVLRAGRPTPLGNARPSPDQATPFTCAIVAPWLM